MLKVDLKKEFKPLYSASVKKVAVVEVPVFNYLMIDGQGNPNTAQAYQEAIEALYSVAYTLKFMVKQSDVGLDFTVMPLEGLWWAEDMSVWDLDTWQWTAMIVQPEQVTPALVEQAAAQAAGKKELPALPLLRLAPLHEGLAAQMMHVGPYSAEGPTIERLHAFIEAEGYQFNGKHHEIYLSDPRRAAPEKLRTIIRQPVTRRKD